MKLFAKSSTLDALTRRAAPPSPNALFPSKRDTWMLTEASAVTAIAPPESVAVLLVKSES